MPDDFVIDTAIVPDPVPVIADALSARLDRSHRERTVWLDTHDWRLFRAGLLLRQQITPGGPWLVLEDLRGRRAARAAVTRAVVTVETLPEQVRERVHDPIGIRALLPRATTDGEVAVLAVLDDEEKTVARVVVEGPTRVKDGDDLGPRARIERLRGYAKAARRAARQLGDLPGLEPAAPQFEAVLGARGLHPGAYRGRPEPMSEAERPAADAFAASLGGLLSILRDNLDGTLRQHDTEFLHDFRIAVRRSRTVVKFATGALDPEVCARWAPELKWLGDRTSRPRDLDVYLLGYDETARQVSSPEVLDPFRDRLVRDRERAHASLNRALRSQRFAALLDGWEREFATPHPGPDGSRPVRDVADELLARTWKRVHKRGAAITPDSPPEALHDLRKRCKELRYLLELFAGLYDPAAHKTIVRELKQLQDNLGEFQDAESQRFLVHGHAEQLASSRVPAATLMGMGRLEHELEDRQAAARDDFARRWGRFDRTRNQSRYSEMVGR